MYNVHVQIYKLLVKVLFSVFIIISLLYSCTICYTPILCIMYGVNISSVQCGCHGGFQGVEVSGLGVGDGLVFAHNSISQPPTNYCVLYILLHFLHQTHLKCVHLSLPACLSGL